ncbi:MAG: protein kinase [Candidatus Melainabacteria bacterium]|nr:protein kinase [Candidatus Melainabacteria bacterium]
MEEKLTDEKQKLRVLPAGSNLDVKPPPVSVDHESDGKDSTVTGSSSAGSPASNNSADDGPAANDPVANNFAADGPAGRPAANDPAANNFAADGPADRPAGNGPSAHSLAATIFSSSKAPAVAPSAAWNSEFNDDQTEDWTQRKVKDETEENLTDELKRIVNFEIKRRSIHAIDDDQVIIGLWPHGNTAPDLGDDAKVRKNSIEKVVGLFAIIWLGVLFWRVFHGSTLGIFINFQSLAPFLIIPLFTMMRGATHLRFDDFGIDFISMNAASLKVRKRVSWNRIKRVYLDGKTEPTPLEQSICLEYEGGSIDRIKLKQIANRGQWQKFLEAFDKWCPVGTGEVDRNIFDSSSQDRTNPTYTMLWLEALAAPPRRERLTPMTEGTVLCKGRYVLERKLGSGGQGSAFLASSTTDESKVVLKEYILPIYVDIKARKQALERFENEAKMLAKLDHPSIVKLIDYFVDDHRAYLVLEYIDGDNLQQLVEKKGPVQDSEACHYAKALVEILSYLHSQSPPVVHRDFTPDNLIASKDGTIKLIDFMVAQQSDMVQQQSASSTVVGKHAYMAPEQFRGQNRTQSDIYALGGTLFYILTGKEPEPITQQHPILEKENCPLILNEIVSKCTEANYLDRFQSVDEIKTKLTRASEEDL